MADDFRVAMDRLAEEDGPKALQRLGEILGNAGKIVKRVDCDRCGNRTEVEFEAIDAKDQIAALKYISDYTLSKPKEEKAARSPADLAITDETTDEQLAQIVLEASPAGATLDQAMGEAWASWLPKAL